MLTTGQNLSVFHMHSVFFHDVFPSVTRPDVSLLWFCRVDSSHEQVPGGSAGTASACRTAESRGRHPPYDRVRVSGRNHEVHAAACGQRRPYERIRQAKRQSVQGEGWLPHSLMMAVQCVYVTQSCLDSLVVNHVNTLWIVL